MVEMKLNLLIKIFIVMYLVFLRNSVNLGPKDLWYYFYNIVCSLLFITIKLFNENKVNSDL